MNAEIENRFVELIERGRQLIRKVPIYEGEPEYWCRDSDIPEFQAWVGSAANLLRVTTTPDTYFSQECNRLLAHDDMARGVPTHILQKLVGLIDSMLEELRRGLLRKAEYIFAATTFDDFLDHASEYHKAGKKVESAVLASAVFEDTLRKVASK